MLNRPPLTILGASARAAAQSAARAGFQPFAIDLFADLDTQAVAHSIQIKRYPAEFLTALAAAPNAPWMYTGSLENYPRLIARLAKLWPLVGNGPEVLMKVRDPAWLAEALAGSDVWYPETVAGDRGQGSGVGSQGSGVREWLSKPRRSGGGMGISRIQSIPEFRPPIPDPGLPTPESRLLVQRFIRGQCLSASLVAVNGQVRWIGAAEQWIGPEWGAPQEFQYAGSLAPAAAVTADEQLQLMRVAKRLALAAGLQGLFGIDLVRNKEGFWLIEVNPRYTASMELFERLSDRCLIAEHCEAFDLGACVQEPRPPRFHQHGAYQAKLIVYASSPGVAGQRLRDTFADLSARGVTAADLPQSGTHFQPSHPICTLLAGGSAPADLREKLLSAAAAVRRSLDPT